MCCRVIPMLSIAVHVIKKWFSVSTALLATSLEVVLSLLMYFCTKINGPSYNVRLHQPLESPPNEVPPPPPSQIKYKDLCVNESYDFVV